MPILCLLEASHKCPNQCSIVIIEGPLKDQGFLTLLEVCDFCHVQEICCLCITQPTHTYWCGPPMNGSYQQGPLSKLFQPMRAIGCFMYHTTHPHLLVRATSERFLLAGATFKFISTNESHHM